MIVKNRIIARSFAHNFVNKLRPIENKQILLSNNNVYVYRVTPWHYFTH